MNTFSVICIFHGNVEQTEVADPVVALRLAKGLQSQGARCVEIYDTNDDLVWQSEGE